MSETTPWWCYALTGVVSAACGIAVLVWPDITLVALAYTFQAIRFAVTPIITIRPSGLP